MKKIMQRHAGKLTLASLAIVFMSSFIYANQAASKNNEGVVLTDHVKGNPDAQLVLEKFGDFQCPHCAAAYPVVDQILEEFGDQVRFEYRHLPIAQIHPYAIAAAEAAEAAGQQDAFFAYHDILYDRQPEWSRSPAPGALFTAYAEELNLDLKRFKQHQNASVLHDRVRSDLREALERGFNSTPTFTLNGERINYGGYEQLRELIMTQLEHGGTVGEDPYSTDLSGAQIE